MVISKLFIKETKLLETLQKKGFLSTKGKKELKRRINKIIKTKTKTKQRRMKSKGKKSNKRKTLHDATIPILTIDLLGDI